MNEEYLELIISQVPADTCTALALTKGPSFSKKRKEKKLRAHKGISNRLSKTMFGEQTHRN